MQVPKFSNITKPVSNYDARITVLTPTHIGAGKEKNWQKGIDYFYQNGLLYVVDTQKLFAILNNSVVKGTQSALDVYTNYLSNGQTRKIEELIREVDVDFDEIVRFRFEYRRDNPPKEIFSLIRTGQGIPIIPGSAIKGAVRSAIFSYLMDKKKLKSSQFHKYTEKDLLGSFSNDIMRFIRFFDAKVTDTEISFIELFNLYREGRDWESDYKNGGLCTVESFCSGASGSFRLDIADGLLRLIGSKNKKELLPPNMQQIWKEDNPIKFLFKIINEHTRRHIKRELDFFNTYNQAEDVDAIIESLEEIETFTKNEDKAILRMSYGSGFHGITGDWRFKNHLGTIEYPDERNLVYNRRTGQREPARYKSRRIADNGRDFNCMGFVEISIP